MANNRGTGGEGEWLQAYLEDAIERRLCTSVCCTTCGAMEFRDGLFGHFTAERDSRDRPLLRPDTALTVAAALAEVGAPPVPDESWAAAVRLIVMDICSAAMVPPIEERLRGSWAGTVLSSMKAHEERRATERRQREEDVVKRREDKERLKAQQQLARAAKKAEIDRRWRERQNQDNAKE